MNGVMPRGAGGSIVQQTVDTSSLIWPVCQTATPLGENDSRILSFHSVLERESNITFFIRIVVLCVCAHFIFIF